MAALAEEAPGQEQLVLTKTVHASERQWARLVIPGSCVGHFQAMQQLLGAQGKDLTIYVCDAGGAADAHTWRWLARMTVQRPMLLDLGPFYTHHGVCAGDVVKVYRNLTSNVLTVALARGAGGAAAVQASTIAAAAAAAAAAAGPQPQPQEAVPQFAAGQLPGQAWVLGPRGGKRSGGPGGGASHPTSPVAQGEEYDVGGYGDHDSDCDYSPTAGGGRKRAGGVRASGPLAVRRALQKLGPEGSGGEGSDQVSTHSYTAEQTRLFDALVDVVARMTQAAQ